LVTSEEANGLALHESSAGLLGERNWLTAAALAKAASVRCILGYMLTLEIVTHWLTHT